MMIFAVMLAAASPNVSDPIAVMPFTNYNEDAKTNWLQRGIADTMVADFKSSKLKVVERDQIERAIREVETQDAKLSEESRAAKVGKMVGARAIVLGGYQKVGNDVRLTARIIEVETSFVSEATKVTGPMTSIFALQDQLAAKLLGKPIVTQRAVARPKAKVAPPQKTVEAYQIYATSAASSDDAERAALLAKALQTDPNFVYAINDLAALEKRLAALRTVADKAADGRIAALEAQLAAEKDPSTRSRVAHDLLVFLERQHRYRAIAEKAPMLDALTLPPDGAVDLRELTARLVVEAHYALRQLDECMKAGEAYLRAYPTSAQYDSVDATIRAVITEMQERENGRTSLEKSLAQHAANRKATFDATIAGLRTAIRTSHERVESLHRAYVEASGNESARLGRELADARGELVTRLATVKRLEAERDATGPDRNLDEQRCVYAHDFRQYARALLDCGAFLTRWADAPLPAPADDADTPDAWRRIVESHVALGDFGAARTAADHLVESHPASSSAGSVRSAMASWPRD